MPNSKTKVYRFWNGKNIDGRSGMFLPSSLEAEARLNDAELKYEISGDTFSANDLQPGIDYDEL